MRQHSALNRGLMFEWLKDLDDTDDRCPSDEAIMERFDFDTPEQARTLLADLVDKGLITMRGVGADRVVTIGKAPAAAPVPSPRPIPSVVKPRHNVDAGVAKIMRIVTRAKPVPAAQPAPVSPPVVLPDPPRRGHQVNIKVSPEHYAALVAEAERDDIAVGRVALRIFELAMAAVPGDTAHPGRKPLIRAEMVLAAQRNNYPLDTFVRLMIERGFASFLADEQTERAA